MLLRALGNLLAPPLCGVCAGPCATGSPLCERCRRALALMRPQPFVVPGIACAAAAAPYEGVARQLVGGLKFTGRLPLARAMASAMDGLVPITADTVVVPVPASPARSRRRGFDPAGEVAKWLARITQAELRPCLARDDGPRQVGRSRALRLGDPPRVRLAKPPPAAVLLVDDVVTTGATLAACAQTLSDGGTQWSAAVAFARSRPN